MAPRRNWHEAAGIIWPVLIDLAKNRKTTTYGEISPILKTNPLSMGLALGPIMFYCLDNRLPSLTAIVVGKDTGVPGGGFSAWDIDDLSSALEAVFSFNWSAVRNPFEGFVDGTRMEDLVEQLLSDPDGPKAVYRLVPDRGMAQTLFRQALLRAYDFECSFCGISFEAALEAAHIVPWSECSADERLNVCNGILLCSNHHRMFDAGLMSLTSSMEIEYFDPNEEHGPYSLADVALSSSLHGKPPFYRATNHYSRVPTL
jgi:putative restriction endonuclease